MNAHNILRPQPVLPMTDHRQLHIMAFAELVRAALRKDAKVAMALASRLSHTGIADLTQSDTGLRLSMFGITAAGPTSRHLLENWHAAATDLLQAVRP